MPGRKNPHCWSDTELFSLRKAACWTLLVTFGKIGCARLSTGTYLHSSYFKTSCAKGELTPLCCFTFSVARLLWLFMLSSFKGCLDVRHAYNCTCKAPAFSLPFSTLAAMIRHSETNHKGTQKIKEKRPAFWELDQATNTTHLCKLYHRKQGLGLRVQKW